MAYFERGQLHRLKAIKTLQSRYCLPLSVIRELLDAVSDDDIRTLAEGRVAPLTTQIVLHHLRVRNVNRSNQERALFEAIVLLVEWHAWVATSPTVSHQRPSLRPRSLEGNMEVEVRQLVTRIVQCVKKSGSRAG